MKHLLIILVICSGSLSASSASVQPDSLSVDSVYSLSLSPSPASSVRCGPPLVVGAVFGVTSGILLYYAFTCSGWFCGIEAAIAGAAFAVGGIVFLLIAGVCYALRETPSTKAPQ